MRGSLVEMEALLSGGIKQPLLEDLLRGVLWELQVVDAGVDRGVEVRGARLLPDDGQAGVEIGQTPWWQGATARHKLNKRLEKKK